MNFSTHNRKYVEKEAETFLFTVAWKYLEINWKMDRKEKFESVKKEVEIDAQRWKQIPCSWTGTVDIMKMSILSKGFYWFSAIPVKIHILQKQNRLS